MTDVIETRASSRPARPSRPWWVLLGGGAAIGLACAATGFAAGRASVPEPAPPDPVPGLAAAATARTLAERVTALNAADRPGMERVYADDAVLRELDQSPPAVTRGGDFIAYHLAAYASTGLRVTQQSVPVEIGRYAAEAASWSTGQGILVYRFDDDGRIAEQWVIGGW